MLCSASAIELEADSVAVPISPVRTVSKRIRDEVYVFKSRITPQTMSSGDDTLYEVTEVAVIKHSSAGVLLLHSDSRQWHLPDSTISVDEAWDQGLYRGVEVGTGFADVAIDSVLAIQNFGPGVVADRPQYGVFFLCRTETTTVSLDENREDDEYRWVADAAELNELELFHPFIEELVTKGLETA